MVVSTTVMKRIPSALRHVSTLFRLDLPCGLSRDPFGMELNEITEADWSLCYPLASDWSRRTFHQRQSLGPLVFSRGNTTQAFLLQGSLIQVSVSTDGELPTDAVPQPVFVDEEPPHRALSVTRIDLGG
ncbi:hypothetical protein GOA98_28120 [Sinorhizobium meliloti]|nr:hypothetical protein [Sinorhizobium meliloti]